MPQPPNVAFTEAYAVFSGKVTAVSGGGGLLSGLLSLVGIGSSFPERRVTFDVGNAWKGVDTTRVTVRTGFGDADCGYGFTTGSDYLVYSYQSEGNLKTNICNRTVAVAATSAADDFTFLATQPTLTLKPADGSNTIVLGLGIAAVLIVIGTGVIFFVRRKQSPKV